MNLLLVDEDQHFARILHTVLENDGHSVFSTTDAASALAMYSAHSPDVLLISADLPRNAGFALLREARRRAGGERLVAMALASHETTELRRECEELDVAQVMIRPFSVLDLAGLIRTVDESRGTGATSAEHERVDVANLQQVVRWWARQSTGVLQVRHERAEGQWITMAKGGPLGPEALVRLKAALYGGDLDFQACDVDGVGDRAGLAVMLWDAAINSEAGRDESPSRAMMAARTRVTDAVAELPAPLAVRRMCELLDAPTSLGVLCDQVGADIGEVSSAFATLVAMGMVSLQGRAASQPRPAQTAQGPSVPPAPSVPPVRTSPVEEFRVPPREESRAVDRPFSTPPRERVYPPAMAERSFSNPPTDRAASTPPRERTFAPERTSTPERTIDRPFSTVPSERIRPISGDRPPPRPDSPRSNVSTHADRPFAAEGAPPRVAEPPEYSRAPASRSTPDAASVSPDAAALRRARRDVDVLRGSDAWVVLGVPRDAPRDLVERAAKRMVNRYETLADGSEGEMRDLALQLLALVRKAAEELAATHAVAAQREQPGDDAFRAGLRAMADGDWPSADKRFAHARDQNLDSPRNLAHLGWSRFHNPDVPMSDRAQDGLDLLRLAEQLDPNYPEGQYFLAVVLHRKGDDEAALRRLRRALKADPGHVASNALARKLRRPGPP